jgi:hypothetical protein
VRAVGVHLRRAMQAEVWATSCHYSYTTRFNTIVSFVAGVCLKIIRLPDLVAISGFDQRDLVFRAIAYS